MKPLRLEAPAKLNLTLRVVGRRDDGYHRLESELVTLELADRLLLLPGCSGLRVEGDGAAGVPLDATNLAWRGLVAGLGEEPSLACLALDKRIPAAAGLGGGSSDAAAAWRLGRAARRIHAPPTAADSAALGSLGADVPFFAAGVSAGRVTGIGERVEGLPAVEMTAVLVHPPFTLSTAAVFAELRSSDWGTDGNDLLAPARRLRPELDELLAAVRHAGAEPRLTGSGPTLFVLDADEERVAAVATQLGTSLRGGARVSRTRTRTTAPQIHAIDEAAKESHA